MPKGEPRICARPMSRTCGTALALVALGIALLAAPANAEVLRTGGTGAALGTMRLLAEAYRKTDPDFRLDIVPNLGSSGGIKALERGAIHFALISRAPTPEETARGLIALEYGRTPFVLATSHAGNGGLTLREVADIYAGKVSTWPDGTPIRVVLRPANDGDTPLLASFSPGVQEALAAAMLRPGMIVAVTDQDSATDIARVKGAIGTSSLALILSENRSLSVLPIEGVKPTVKALADGSYPHFKSVHIVTLAKPSESVRRFIAFVRSAQGRRILAETGHWVPESRDGAAAR